MNYSQGNCAGHWRQQSLKLAECKFYSCGLVSIRPALPPNSLETQDMFRSAASSLPPSLHFFTNKGCNFASQHSETRGGHPRRGMKGCPTSELQLVAVRMETIYWFAPGHQTESIYPLSGGRFGRKPRGTFRTTKIQRKSRGRLPWGVPLSRFSL